MSKNSEDQVVGRLLVRRSEATDAPEINTLLNDDTLNVFGIVNIKNLMEKCLLSVTVTDEDERILAYAGFSDSSHIPYNYDSDFNYLAWMGENFEMDSSVNYFNSLFLICFAALPCCDIDCARLAMRVLFNDVPDLQNCFLICSPGIPLNEPLITVFHPLACNFSTNHEKWRGFVAVREQHAQLLHVREARVEDNDDLIPLFNERSSTLRKTFGEYFIAEFVKMQSETMKCIVADVEGVAVGFMSINAKFNPEVTKYFELTSFNELREPHPDDVFYNSDPSDVDIKNQIAYSFVQTNAFSFSKSTSQLNESYLKKGSVVSRMSERSYQTDDIDALENDVTDEPEDDEYLIYADLHSNKLTTLKFVNFADLPTTLYQFNKHAAPQAPKLQTSVISAALDIRTSNLAFPKFEKVTDLKMIPQDNTSLHLLSMLSQKAHFKGTFHGKHSCVCIELFAIDPKFSQRSCDFLLKIFEMFPHVKYCIISVPHLVPEFSLLQRFSRVTPLLTKHIPHELYVFCSAGILDSLIIRQYVVEDEEPIKQMVANLKNYHQMLNDLEQFVNYGVDEERNEMSVFVAEVEHQIIGFAILRKEENLEYLCSHYELESFIYYHQHKRGGHAQLMHFVLNPIFNHYSNHFLKELMRQTKKTCFYYYFYNNGESMTTISTVMKDMIPIKARRQIEYDFELLGNNVPSEKITCEEQSFAILHINRKLVLGRRTTINARIVVVGASDTAIAFLESLVFTPYLRFNNLTIVSPNGLPGERTPTNFRRLLLAHNNCYNWSSFSKMGLKIWVNVVYGKMTAINRQNKMLTVNHKTYVPYDYLILCTGTQYLVTCPIEMDPTGVAKSSARFSTPPGRQFLGNLPRAIFTINDPSDADKLLCYLNEDFLERDRLVVHGNTLDAYCCINGLLCFGLKPSQIVFAISPNEDEITCFNNPDIDCKMVKTLNLMAGMTVWRDVLITKWSTSRTKLGLNRVTFKDTKGQGYAVNCKALILFNYRGVDYNAFEAINCSSLVFDRRMVIDANFRTNDPSIRAAGPLTKYQRMYYSEDWTHANYNVKEVGYHLASAMMHIFDPSHNFQPTTPYNDAIKLIPEYTWPKVQSGVLPGMYNYLHIHKPQKRQLLMKVEVESPDHGYELLSGSVDDKQKGYFRLHVNCHKLVQTITCFTRKDIKADNLICLYGLHHRFLNNLLGRWFEGLITDLYSYFSQPWAMLLYHDRFPLLREEVREAIVNQYIDMTDSGKSETLNEFIGRVMDDNFLMMEKDKKLLSKKFVESALDKTTKEKLATFITHNHTQLPMYIRPIRE